MKYTGKIDRQHPLPCSQGILGDRPEDPGDPGVVDGNVEASEARDDGIDRRLSGNGIGDIARHENRVMAGGVQFCDDSLAADLISESSRFGMDALVEVHDEAEMARARRLGATLIGVNNRDLRTFVTDLAITERLAACAPANALLVTESGVFTPADARRLDAAGARAMLVGESLMRQQDVEAATRALIGS